MWFWRISIIISDFVDFFYGRICSMFGIFLMWVFWGNKSILNGEVFIIGKDEEFNGIRG